jgi:hypothetical protein
MTALETGAVASCHSHHRPAQAIKKTSRRSDPYFRRTHTSDALSYCLAFDAPALSTARRPRPPVRVKPPAYGFTTSAP